MTPKRRKKLLTTQTSSSQANLRNKSYHFGCIQFPTYEVQQQQQALQQQQQQALQQQQQALRQQQQNFCNNNKHFGNNPVAANSKKNFLKLKHTNNAFYECF
jgi:hypothetical protein